MESSCRVGRLVLGLVGLVLLVLGLVVQTRVRHSSREREGGARQVGQAAQMNATLVILNFTASIFRVTLGENPKIEAKYQAGGLQRHYEVKI